VEPPGILRGINAAWPAQPGQQPASAGPLPAATDPRQVPGEVIEDGGYHYYPSRPQVRQWLDTAGFTVTGQADDGEYWHLLLTRR
jgi:hypothetical protein